MLSTPTAFTPYGSYTQGTMTVVVTHYYQQSCIIIMTIDFSHMPRSSNQIHSTLSIKFCCDRFYFFEHAKWLGGIAHLARHVTFRHDTTRSTCRAHSFWLCRVCRTALLDTLDTTSSTGSTRSSRRARHDELKWLDTSNVSSPCNLAVSSLSNSTARHARHVERVVSTGNVPNEIWT